MRSTAVSVHSHLLPVESAWISRYNRDPLIRHSNMFLHTEIYQSRGVLFFTSTDFACPDNILSGSPQYVLYIIFNY